MQIFCCPVCSAPLTETPQNYHCEKGHSFDRSKYGYVNLLLSQKSAAKHSGDDKKMVRARKEFLSCGYYLPLRDALIEMASPYLKNGGTLLDAGCGEGYYTEGFLSRFNGLSAYGIDISKEALIEAGKRRTGLKTAVAGIFHLPILSDSCDLMLNIFAPCCEEEFHRVLKDNGILMRVIPMENHLWELKAAIYDKPYLNDNLDTSLKGFTLLEEKELTYSISLEPPQIENLFMMTPYYYKTSAKDQEKCANLKHLETKIEFKILLYQKTE